MGGDRLLEFHQSCWRAGFSTFVLLTVRWDHSVLWGRPVHDGVLGSGLNPLQASGDSHSCLQTLPGVPLLTKLPQVESHFSRLYLFPVATNK